MVLWQRALRVSVNIKGQHILDAEVVVDTHTMNHTGYARHVVTVDLERLEVTTGRQRMLEAIERSKRHLAHNKDF